MHPTFESYWKQKYLSELEIATQHRGLTLSKLQKQVIADCIRIDNIRFLSANHSCENLETTKTKT